MSLKTVLKVSAYSVAALATLGLATLALPRHVHVQRSAVVAAAPEALFALLSSSRGFNRFNPFLEADPQLQISFSGPESGVGAAFAWHSRKNEGSQTIVQTEANHSVQMQLDLGPMGRPIQRFELQATSGGTRVTWHQHADMGYNPIARVIGLTLDGYLGPIYERGLVKLGSLDQVAVR
jgi:Polyketide cyclase / dehydrase and lipid transport